MQGTEIIEGAEDSKTHAIGFEWNGNSSMQVTLKLLTDIEPGAANSLSTLEDAAVTRSAGPGWEYTGNSSLLKSALQKNVRLGRADASVRYSHTSNQCYSTGQGACPGNLCQVAEQY